MTAIEDLLKSLDHMGPQDLFELAYKVAEQIRGERERGTCCGGSVTGGLVTLPADRPLVVVGDLHGDLRSL
ncbi:MAG: hypothetical protein QW390_04440, partial [Candidatus Bathyarchaeia archaeon]